jgi:hypothetical protein
MTSATENRDTFVVLPRPRRASVRQLPDAAQPDVPVRRPPTQHGESPHGESPSTAPDTAVTDTAPQWRCTVLRIGW